MNAAIKSIKKNYSNNNNNKKFKIRCSNNFFAWINEAEINAQNIYRTIQYTVIASNFSLETVQKRAT